MKREAALEFLRHVRGHAFRGFFLFWEKLGLHVTPVSRYSPIPNSRELKQDLWTRESELPGVDLNIDGQLSLLTGTFPRFKSEYDDFPRTPSGNPMDFYFNNPWFSGTDALVLYCMVRHF